MSNMNNMSHCNTGNYNNNNWSVEKLQPLQYWLPGISVRDRLLYYCTQCPVCVCTCHDVCMSVCIYIYVAISRSCNTYPGEEAFCVPSLACSYKKMYYLHGNYYKHLKYANYVCRHHINYVVSVYDGKIDGTTIDSIMRQMATCICMCEKE